MRLDPSRPIIDITRDIKTRDIKRTPKPKPARVKRWATPKTATPTAAVQSKRGLKVAPLDDLSGVSREELPPLPGADDGVETYGSGSSDAIGARIRRTGSNNRDNLPSDLWRGVSMKRFEQISRDYAVRPKSRAVRDIWVQIFRSSARPPEGAHNEASFEALRMQGLYRLGAFEDVIRLVERVPEGERHSILKILMAKSQVALGQDDEACGSTKTLISEQGKVAASLQREYVEISAYCAVRADDMPRAGLIVELARDSGLDAPETFSILDAMTSSKAPRLPRGNRIALIPGKLLVLGGYKPRGRFLNIATPALLNGIAVDASVDADIRLAAAEQAAMRGTLTPKGLRRAYLTARGGSQAASKRAEIMKQIDRASRGGGSGAAILRDAQALLARSRTGDLYPVVAAMLGPDVRAIRQSRETQRFAETAIEIVASAGALDAAVGWAIFGSSYDTAGNTTGHSGLMHWLMPVDIADARRGTARGAGLKPTETLALRGRFSSDVLHRLVTILDGLGYTMPIPLWEAASRTPQPAKGYLPKTGVLAQLRSAAKNRETGHTLMLSVAALGPNGAKGANLIGLGDTLRALRSAGLGEQARALAFEAVFPTWPRRSG